MDIQTLRSRVLEWSLASPDIDLVTTKIILNPMDIEDLRLEKGMDNLPESFMGLPLASDAKLDRGEIVFTVSVHIFQSPYKDEDND